MLAALVICGAGIALAAQDDSEAAPVAPQLSSAPQEDPGVELKSERTATSQTFRLPDGALTTRLYENPVNYRGEEGDWKPIDEELEDAPGGGLTNGENSFDLSLPSRMGAGPVRISTDDQWVSYQLLGPRTEAAELDGATASYESSRPGVDFDLSSLANGVKEQIEIADASQPSSFDFELSASDGLTPSLSEAGAIEFRDSAGALIAVLPAPVMSDSSPGQPQVSHAVHYQLETQGQSRWKLSVEADREWLSQPDRIWPVDLDPTLTVSSPALDCTISGKTGSNGSGVCGSSGQKQLYAAYLPGTVDEWKRSLLRFEVDPHHEVIPVNAYIAAAKVGVHAPSAVQNTSGLELRAITKSWNKEANWRKRNHSEYWTAEGGDYNSEGAQILTSQHGSQAGWWNFSEGLAPLVDAWISGKTANNGLLLKLLDDHSRECNGSSCTQRSATFDSSAATDSSLRPYLEVTYYTAAPAGSKVTSPSEGTVTSRRLKLKSTGVAGTTGVTFQFREGKSGAFQTIPSSLVRNAQGQEVKWPVVVSEGQHEPLYFDAAHASAALRSHGGPIQVRALFDGLGVAGYSVPVEATVNRFLGAPRDATASVGPGSLDLLTGNLTVSRTDVSIPGFGSALEFARTHSSRDAGSSGAAGVLGQGWKPGVAVEEAGGAEWRSVRLEAVMAEEENEAGEISFVQVGEYALLTDLEGYEYAFEKSGGSFVTPPEAAGWVLTQEGANFALTDTAGDRTVFQNYSGGNEYLPVSISQTGGSANTTQMVYQLASGKRKLTMIIAPSPAGVTCNETTAKTTVGCRSLIFEYTEGQHFGPEVKGERLTSIVYYGPSGANSISHWEVANYAYNTEGRLTEEWDPRVSPALKEKYTYEAGGQLRTITPPGEEPWTMEYGSYDEEEANGRLVAVKRPSLLASPTTAQTTIAYGVPLSGSGAPYDLSGSAVAAWGQQDIPTDATAIFPPDEIPANPPSAYSRATVYYLDTEGQQVNVATPSGAGTSAPSITTAEADEHGNVLRELSAQNRLRALAAGSESVTRSHELETKRSFSADGAQMQEEWGPLHQVRLESGKTVQARLRRVVQYDEGWPGTGVKPHLPTSEMTGAVIPGEGAEADQRTSETKYDWTLRKPTETIVDPGSLKLRTRIAYDSVSGLPTERSLPAKPSGGDAHTTKTIYWSAGSNPLDSACSNSPGWANLPCKVTPAEQPGTPGQPELLVTKFASYNALAEPTEAIESPGGGAQNTRTTITAYDTVGRATSRKQVGGGTSLPPTQTLYSSTTGRPVEQRFTCESGCEGFDNQATTTTYDKLGRPTAYQDADGNTSSATYDLLGRPVTTSDGKGIQTRTYDPTSGLLVKLEDSGAGAFTAAYDADGNMVEQGLPDGLLAKTTYNEAGEPTHLSYEKKTFCSIGCTWLDFGAERSIYGQVLSQSGLSSSQVYSYDHAGRLTLVRDTPQGGGCTTRTYNFDADSNRTKLITRSPGIGGACDTNSEGTPHSYSYDAADRLIDSGIVYDNYGRITSLPGADAGGETLTTSYYSNNLVQSQTQGAITNTYQLDSALRQRLRTQTGGSEPGTEVYHYAGGSDSPAWIDRSTSWSRSIAGIDGSLAAVQDSAKGTTLQLTNLHGDIVATASANSEATKLLASFEFDEFGNPKQASAPKYGWLGGKGRRTELPSGVIQMGVRSYVPTLGRFLTPDPIEGGSANAYDYAYQDPVNMFDLTGLCGHRGERHNCHQIYEERDRIRRKTNRRSREQHLHAPVVTTRKCTALACRVGWPHGGTNDALGSFLEGAANKVVHLVMKYGTTRALGWARSTENEQVMGCAKDATEAWIETAELRAAGAADGPVMGAGTTITSALYAAASCVGGASG